MRRYSLALAAVALAVAGCSRPEVAVTHDFLSPADQALVAAGATRNPLIAVIDGGIAADHRSLQGKLARRWRAEGLDAAVSAHATQVAGIIAGTPHESYPGGLARGARILDVKALDERGAGKPDDVASAFRWAIAQDADLIVASFGIERDHPAIRDAVTAAISAGVTVVASTGNGFGDFDFFPAGYDGVVGITSYDRNGERSALANSKGADFAAPGEDILAPTTVGGYATVSGTSIAAATAAGLIAACWDIEAVHELTTESGRSWGGRSIGFASGKVPLLACPTSEVE